MSEYVREGIISIEVNTNDLYEYVDFMFANADLCLYIHYSPFDHRWSNLKPRISNFTVGKRS